jgi:hypothetical protein
MKRKFPKNITVKDMQTIAEVNRIVLNYQKLNRLLKQLQNKVKN